MCVCKRVFQLKRVAGNISIKIRNSLFLWRYYLCVFDRPKGQVLLQPNTWLLSLILSLVIRGAPSLIIAQSQVSTPLAPNLTYEYEWYTKDRVTPIQSPSQSGS